MTKANPHHQAEATEYIQIDVWKATVKAKPSPPTPAPDTWAGVGKELHAMLRQVACDAIGLPVDIIRGARSIVRTLTGIRAPNQEKIEEGQDLADKREAESAAMSVNTSTDDVLERTNAILDRLQSQGIPCSVRELKSGDFTIVLAMEPPHADALLAAVEVADKAKSITEEAESD